MIETEWEDLKIGDFFLDADNDLNYVRGITRHNTIQTLYKEIADDLPNEYELEGLCNCEGTEIEWSEGDQEGSERLPLVVTTGPHVIQEEP